MQLWADLEPALTGTINFSRSKQPILRFDLKLAASFGEVLPLAPGPGTLDRRSHVVGVYTAKSVVQYDVQSSRTTEDALQMLSSAILDDPSPEVNLTFQGKAALRRAFKYPVQKATGIVLHTIRSKAPLTPVFQVVEMAMFTEPDIIGRTPDMFYQGATDFQELRLDLEFHPMVETSFKGDVSLRGGLEAMASTSRVH